jgi:2-dehydropantoate 2-reductase
VTVVDREQTHIEAIKERGLRITGPVDTFTVFPDAFTTKDIEGQHGAIFLCVKAHDTAGAMDQIQDHLAPEGFVVSIQNGLNERIISSQIGEERTVGCFVNFDADYLDPGVIHYGGRGAVVVGELTGEHTPRLKSLHEALLEFDRGAIQTENIWGYLWSKLAFGAMLFATALTDLPVSQVLAIQEYESVFVALVREVFAVSDSKFIELESFDGFDPRAFRVGVIKSCKIVFTSDGILSHG